MKEKNKTIIKLISTITLTIYFIFWIYTYIKRMSYHSIIPAEYRDYAMVGVINDFLNGKNPFSLKALLSVQKPNILVSSGIIHLLPTLCICKIFKTNILLTIYFVNMIYGILTAVISFMIIIKECNNKILASMSATLALTYLSRDGLLISRPDVFALLFELIMLYCILKNSKKNLNYFIISLSAILIILAKPHYVLIFLAYLLILFWQKDWIALKKCLNYSFLIGSIVLIFMILFMPVYVATWIEMMYEMFWNVGESLNQSSNTIYLINKWAKIFIEFLVLFIIVLLGIGFSLSNKCLKNKIQITLHPILVICLILNAISLCFTGRHHGASLWYFYFTFIPFLNILAFILLHAIYKNSQYKKICYFLEFILIVWTGIRIIGFYPSTNEQNLLKANNNAECILNDHLSENMFLSPVLSGISLKKGIYNYDLGDTIYAPSEDRILMNLIPFMELNSFVKEKYANYNKQILKNIEKKEYSIIAIDSIDIPIAYDTREKFWTSLEENYQKINSETFYGQNQQYNITYYTPKL